MPCLAFVASCIRGHQLNWHCPNSSLVQDCGAPGRRGAPHGGAAAVRALEPRGDPQRAARVFAVVRAGSAPVNACWLLLGACKKLGSGKFPGSVACREVACRTERTACYQRLGPVAAGHCQYHMAGQKSEGRPLPPMQQHTRSRHTAVHRWRRWMRTLLVPCSGSIDHRAQLQCPTLMA